MTPQQQKYVRVASDLKYTPTVRALFVTLAEPFFYNATDEKGSYSVTLQLDPEKDGDFLLDLDRTANDLLDDWLQETGTKANSITVKSPSYYRRDEEDEEGNTTGNQLVKFKKNGTGQRKGGSRFTIKMPVVDGQGNEVPADVVARLGRGTRMVVAYRAEAYCMSGVFGITLKIEAVQIVEPMFRKSNDSADAFKGREVEEAFTVADLEE